jgi:hypothetical protein
MEMVSKDKMGKGIFDCKYSDYKIDFAKKK